MKAVRRLAETRASAAIEFCLIGTVLFAALCGMANYALYAWVEIQISNAAGAGAAYARMHGFSGGAIQLAAQSATGLGVSVAVAATENCGCATVTGIDPMACGSFCAQLNNAQAGSYVTVVTTYHYTPIVGILSPATADLTATAIARIS